MLPFHEVKRICGKGEAEPFWISRFLIRPWTPYVSYVALRLGLTPAQVTVGSALLAVTAGLIALWPSTPSYLGAAGLTVAFFVLDHVDGEMARVRQAHAPRSGNTLDVSGKYLDRLVHYFQGPTLFLGASVGIAVSEAQPLWALVGIVCALGSSGFPRFTAAYDLLVVASRSSSDHNRSFLRRASDFSGIYGEGLLTRGFVVVPRTLPELLSVARQYVGFPGNLFVVSAAFIFDGVRLPEHSPLALKVVCLGYAIILLGNLLYATWKYYALLSDVPE